MASVPRLRLLRCLNLKILHFHRGLDRFDRRYHQIPLPAADQNNPSSFSSILLLANGHEPSLPRNVFWPEASCLSRFLLRLS